MLLNIHHTQKHFQQIFYYLNSIGTSRWESSFLTTIRFREKSDYGSVYFNLKTVLVLLSHIPFTSFL